MITSCAIYFIFLMGMIYIMTSVDKSELMKDFNSVLSNEQKIKYSKIRKERFTIYIKGYILGLILSLFFIIKIENSINRICIVGAVTMVTNYFYYILHKKSDYIILHLETEEKREKWLKIYKYMQSRYHIGLLFGLLSVISLGIKL